VSAQAKREYVQAIYQRYRQASRPDKQRILDEFCQVAHYHRKYAIRLLNGPAPGAARPPRRRPVTYGAAVIEALGRSGGRPATPGPCGSRRCCRSGWPGRGGGGGSVPP